MKDDEIRDFTVFVGELRRGIANEELSIALEEVTEAVMRTGKTGSLQLVIKIKPQGNRQVEITDAIKKVIPEPNRMPTIMFCDGNNSLSRSDTRQMTFDELKVVEDKKSPVIVMGDEETGEQLKEVVIQ